MCLAVCALVGTVILVARGVEANNESSRSIALESSSTRNVASPSFSSDADSLGFFGLPDLGVGRRVLVRNVTSLTGQQILARPFATRVIVSEKSRLIYCPIPKAASSNWKYLIRKFEGLDDYLDLSKAHSPELSGLRYLTDYSPAEVERILNDPSYFKFTFVRDPYSRTLSCYLNKFQNHGEEYVRTEYRSFLAQLFDWRYAREVAIESEPRPSFSAFVDEIAKQTPFEMNAHWAPQTLLCGLGEMPYDFVGKMEHLQADVEHVFNKIGRPGEHFPTQAEIGFPPSGATDAMFNDLYTVETMMKIRVIFDIDFNSGFGASSEEVDV
jgi:Sulfotransferase family